jgi:NADH-quinone oxidoreductase subunit C
MTEDAFRRALEQVEHGPASTVAPAPHVPPLEREVPEHPSVTALRARFGAAILRHEVVSGDEHIVYIEPDRNVEILRWLHGDPAQRYDYLADLTAVDYGGGRPIQVVYQLWSIPHKRALRVKAELPLDRLEIDSVVAIWNSANWLEREVYDMFGVIFRGHPDLRRILMPYNYAEGHPLRKDFPLRGRFSRAEQTRRALAMTVEDYYSPYELDLARRLGQPLPEIFAEMLEGRDFAREARGEEGDGA